MNKFFVLILISLLSSCLETSKNIGFENSNSKPTNTGVSLIVLGTIQDAGSPHIACKKNCCKDLFEHPDKNRKVVSLGVVDFKNQKKYMFEATPDMGEQMKLLYNYSSFNKKETPDGIFVTHAHLGHYAGLMYLGKEAMSADKVPVFAMPKMKTFLEQNGPWSQLVTNKNISLQPIFDNKEIELTSNLRVIPFTVPHRDEFSETVGYTIVGPNKKVLFIPDIDKWEKWKTNIADAISKVDYAFVDATFYDGAEINNRDISTIPHPFIIETMAMFEKLSATEKKKIYFIHFNHTNPVINIKSKEAKLVLTNGFNIAQMHSVIKL